MWQNIMKYLLQTYLPRRPKTASKERIRYANAKFLLSINEQQLCKLKKYITQDREDRVTVKNAAIQ